jgi:hypothetical protein
MTDALAAIRCGSIGEIIDLVLSFIRADGGGGQ